MENEFKLQKTYEIKSYESNSRRRIKPHMLLHYFEDIAYDSAENLGFGYSQIYPKGLAWFVLKYGINIIRVPKTWEKVTIITWPSENKGALCRREFEMIDKENNIILSASSLWGLIDANKKRLVNAKKVLDYPVLTEEYATSTDFSAINFDKNFTNSKEIEILYDHIDLNGHVNNSNYVAFAYNALPYEFLVENSTKEIQIEYKNETKFQESVLSEAKIDVDKNISYHKLTNKSTGVDLCYLKIKWERDVINK